MMYNQASDPNTFLSVDKIMLFAILYTPSTLKNTQGNLAKGVMFCHLLDCDRLVQKIQRKSAKLRQFLQYIFEFCQSTLESDPDDRQRLYFREPIAYFNNEDEQLHQKIIEWVYQEFLKQIFGSVNEVSCIQFIERIACAHVKQKKNIN